MSNLKPIPTPLRMRWLQLRQQLLPILVCGGAGLAVVSLWTEVAGPVGIPGEVEVLTGGVTAPDSGVLTELQIERFGRVEAGQTIGWLITTPPDVTTSSLSVLKAEIELTRLGWFDAALDQRRNLLEVENTKLDLLAARTEIAIAQTQLLQARRDLTNKQRLAQSGIVSDDELQQAQLLADVLEAEVKGKEELTAQYERSLESLGAKEGEGADFPEALRATLALQSERLKLLEAELRPVPLRAPIAGIVNNIFHQNGETVPAGAMILTITSPHSDTVVAYLRQPLSVQPEVGGSVEIRSRRQDKLRGSGEIVAIGSHVQQLTLGLQRPLPFHYESGLPIRVTLPPELGLVPGEVVDVILQ